MIAWEKCAEANERTGNDWHAGKHLEQCAQLARDLALHDQVVAYAERACAAYVSAGRAQRGAECLGKIARLIDEAAPDEAYDLASRACEMLEDDGKGVVWYPYAHGYSERNYDNVRIGMEGCEAGLCVMGNADAGAHVAAFTDAVSAETAGLGR